MTNGNTKSLVGRRDGVWMAYPAETPVPVVTPYASEIKALRTAARDNLKVVFVAYGTTLADALNTPPETEPEPPAPGPLAA
jgi:hypothetical protein